MTLRRVTTAVLAGVLATAATVPAFAADQGTTTVTYTSGVLVPPDANGSYYVTIPADVVLSVEGSTGAKGANVSIFKNPASSNPLPTNLEVLVKVYSANSYQLTNSGGSTTPGTYTLAYSTSTGATATSPDTPLSNAGSTGGATADNAASAGTFQYQEGWASIGSGTALATLSGTATLTQAPEGADGTSFTDTLTFFVDQTSVDPS